MTERRKSLHVMLSDQERIELERQAQLAGLSVSAYLRQIIRAEHERLLERAEHNLAAITRQNQRAAYEELQWRGGKFRRNSEDEGVPASNGAPPARREDDIEP